MVNRLHGLNFLSRPMLRLNFSRRGPVSPRHTLAPALALGATIISLSCGPLPSARLTVHTREFVMVHGARWPAPSSSRSFKQIIGPKPKSVAIRLQEISIDSTAASPSGDLLRIYMEQQLRAPPHPLATTSTHRERER
jgi:hypothetical protein